MTTLKDRPNTALIIIDVQNGVMKASVNSEAVIGTIAGLVGKARAAGTPVIWVQHNSNDLKTGSDAWKIAPALVPGEGEPVIQKEWGDAFEATNLEELLAGLKVGRLVVSGAQTDACIRSTLHGGFTRGYDMTLVGDAHTTEDMSKWGAPPPEQVIKHTNLYWAYQDGPGRKGATVKAADVDFASCRLRHPGARHRDP